MIINDPLSLIYLLTILPIFFDLPASNHRIHLTHRPLYLLDRPAAGARSNVFRHFPLNLRPTIVSPVTAQSRPSSTWADLVGFSPFSSVYASIPDMTCDVAAAVDDGVDDDDVMVVVEHVVDVEHVSVADIVRLVH